MGMIQTRMSHPPRRAEEGIRIPSPWLVTNLFVPEKLREPACPLMAQSRHKLVHCTCPLLGVKRTWKALQHSRQIRAHNLRIALKVLKRRYGLRAVTIRQS